MIIYNHKDLFINIKKKLFNLLQNNILNILPAGGTNYKLYTNSYFPSKDLDLILVLNNEFDYVKKLLFSNYHKYFSTINESTFTNRQLFLKYKEYDIDILLIDNDIDDINYMSEFRFNGNSEIIKSKYRNNLLISIFKSYGILLEKPNIYKYCEYINVNVKKYIDNIYEYNGKIENIFMEKITNYNWVLLFNSILNINYSIKDYMSFFKIVVLLDNINNTTKILMDFYNSLLFFDEKENKITINYINNHLKKINHV